MHLFPAFLLERLNWPYMGLVPRFHQPLSLWFPSPNESLGTTDLVFDTLETISLSLSYQPLFSGSASLPLWLFLVADTQLYKRLCPSVRPLVGPSVIIESKSEKTRISAPAHPSATGMGRVFGLVD